MKEPQNRAPLAAALRWHRRRETLSFHLPGHKGNPPWRDITGLWCDVTELPGLDDLHAPSGPIAEAQDLCARFYGADYSFFLVNGSTAGMQALCLAALNPGDELLLPRHVHRSAVAGLVLSGAVPIWIPSRWEESLGIPFGPAPEDLDQALTRHPRARAVVLINPNYQGFCPDLKALIALARSRGLLVLADEAHGAHLRLSDRLPPDALSLGAGASIMSFHKTLGSLTGSSVLHLSGGRIDPRRVQSALRMLQTSSPSYMMMATLDLARRRAARQGGRITGDLIEAIWKFRTEIAALENLDCLGPGLERRPGLGAFDPFKLILVPRTGAARDWTEALAKQGVGLEMTAPGYLLGVVGLGDRPRSLACLASALGRVSGEMATSRASASNYGRPGQGPPRAVPVPAVPPAAMTPRRAYFSPRAWVPLAESTGRIAADCVTISPPGSVILCPGEAVTEETVRWLIEATGRGETVPGIEFDRGLPWLPVVAG